jgi:hypothetical protein
MISTVIFAAIDPSVFQGFLTYGPIGLAGLMLVLVVTALSLRWNLTAPAAKLLERVLYVGAFCFVAALIAQYLTSTAPMPDPPHHTLGLSVYPNGLDGSGLPPAKITINSNPIAQPVANYKIESDVNAVVDVNQAVEYAKSLGRAYIEQQRVTASSVNNVNDLVKELNSLNAQVQDVAARVAGNVCPGGAHGVPIPGADRLVEQTTQISNRLKGVGATLSQSLATSIRVLPAQ